STPHREKAASTRQSVRRARFGRGRNGYRPACRCTCSIEQLGEPVALSEPEYASTVALPPAGTAFTWRGTVTAADPCENATSNAYDADSWPWLVTITVAFAPKSRTAQLRATTSPLPPVEESANHIAASATTMTTATAMPPATNMRRRGKRCPRYVDSNNEV